MTERKHISIIQYGTVPPLAYYDIMRLNPKILTVHRTYVATVSAIIQNPNHFFFYSTFLLVASFFTIVRFPFLSPCKSKSTNNASLRTVLCLTYCTVLYLTVRDVQYHTVHSFRFEKQQMLDGWKRWSFDFPASPPI